MGHVFRQLAAPVEARQMAVRVDWATAFVRARPERTPEETRAANRCGPRRAPDLPLLERLTRATLACGRSARRPVGSRRPRPEPHGHTSQRSVLKELPQRLAASSDTSSVLLAALQRLQQPLRTACPRRRSAHDPHIRAPAHEAGIDLALCGRKACGRHSGPVGGARMGVPVEMYGWIKSPTASGRIIPPCTYIDARGQQGRAARILPRTAITWTSSCQNAVHLTEAISMCFDTKDLQASSPHPACEATRAGAR
jgi:hypothetical protein